MPIIQRSYYDAAEKGRQDAAQAAHNALAMQQGQAQLQQDQRVNALMSDPNATPEQYARQGRTDVAYGIDKFQNSQANAQAEQQKAEATKMVQFAQYGIQSANPKRFIEQNAPQLVAHWQGTPWETASDEEVKAGLQDAIGQYGPLAGIGPQAAKGSGPLYKVVDSQTGEITYAPAQEASGKNPYVYKPPQRTPTGEKRPTPPRGFRYKEDGSVEPIPGGPNDPNSPNRPTQNQKPPTEGDKRARVMYFSMKNAEKQLEGVSSSDTSNLGQAILGKTDAGRVLQSDEFKRYESAGLRWAANLLYLKSGATATPEEIRSTWLQFFPQPGDGPSVKAQKNEARQQEMGAINDTYTFEKVTAPPATSQPNQQGWSIKPL